MKDKMVRVDINTWQKLKKEKEKTDVPIVKILKRIINKALK